MDRFRNDKQFSHPSVEEIHEFARELHPECWTPTL